jgi:hypothetical protein
MILRLEVDKIGYVFCGGALRLTRVSQTRAGRASRFILSRQPVTIKCLHFEVFEQQGRAIFLLPQPVFNRCQRNVEIKYLPGVRRLVGALVVDFP